jgi:hypothetical protein
MRPSDQPIRPRGRLAYWAAFTVNDRQEPEAAEAVRKRLGPAAVSAAFEVALLRLLADWPVPSRPDLGRVSVAATDPNAPDPFQADDRPAVILRFPTVEQAGWFFDTYGGLAGTEVDDLYGAEVSQVIVKRPEAGQDPEPPASGANVPEGAR